MKHKQLLTPQQISQQYGIGQQMLRRYRMRGDGPPFYKLSERSYRYDRAEFEAWLNTRHSQQTTA
jgi:predicted DNA-binding transcriptional regulator AlpA